MTKLQRMMPLRQKQLERYQPLPGEITSIITKVEVISGSELRFAAWQSRFTRAISAFEGFVSIELIPVRADSAEWQIIQRFVSPTLLDRWRMSSEKAKLFSDLAAFQKPDAPALSDEPAPDFHSLSSVTEVITTVVEQGRLTQFLSWSQRAQERQATFPGYMGTLIQAPISNAAPYWMTLVRFATPAQLDAWLDSKDRKALLASPDYEPFAWKSHRIENGFASWFSNSSGEASPPAWKQTMLVLLVLFPVVMLETMFLSPHLASMHLPVAIFIGNALSVALVSWPLMAIAIACLRWWLKPAPARRWRMEMLGLASVLSLYSIEILIFMQLLPI
ncbi:antibiotic biosynthesis monooxygenase [Microvirga sp. WGZ8]|uniref:Antibiotic biosynthesis monooxygenase n=1 Tax=Microvirga puerhi TaxID=2876078 RepID=A0ABS7VPX4_9HYPH|nr:antibiotic biosynthesis monooxygenase [Microvirga puerhi]